MPYPQDLVGKYLRFAMPKGISMMNSTLTPSLANHLLVGQEKTVTATVHDGPVPTPIAMANYTPPVTPPAGAWSKPAAAGAGGAAARAPGALGGHRVGAGPWASARPNNANIRAPGALGAQRNVAWNFTWLPYIAGATTAAPIGNGSLTGPMSGCYLFTFQHNNVQHFAHVGTYDFVGDKSSVAAKSAWIEYNRAHGQAKPMGGSPAELFGPVERGRASLQPALPNMMPMVFGYATPSGDIWSILAAPVPKEISPVPGATDFFYVSDAKKMNLQAWSTIAPLRTFQLHGDDEAPIMTGVIKGSNLRR